MTAPTPKLMRDRLVEVGLLTAKAVPCERCKGTGAIDAPYSGSDPSCPDCDGEGQIEPSPRSAP